MFTEGQQCPACGEGKISKTFCPKEFEYKGVRKTLHGHEFFCDKCGESFVTPDLAREYKEELVNFFREVDGLLKPSEIREIRQKFGLTQCQLALKLGVGEKNFARYENGTVAQSKSMDLLLRVLKEYPETFYRVVERRDTLQSDAITETIVVNVPSRSYALNSQSKGGSFNSVAPFLEALSGQEVVKRSLIGTTGCCVVDGSESDSNGCSRKALALSR